MNYTLQKIAINTRYGGFTLSHEAKKRLIARGHTGHVTRSIESRTNPDLIAVIEELGAAASYCSGDIGITLIPTDASLYIQEYDGLERVVERHRIWAAAPMEENHE